MRKFYTGANNQIDHLEGINIVRIVVSNLKKTLENPMSIMECGDDFLGGTLDAKDPTLLKLRMFTAADDTCRGVMITACAGAVVDVLERQYKRYFGLDINEKLRKETETARSHNIDAEQVMGMFSAAKNRSLNATMCYLSSRMRATKNQVVPYIHTMERKEQERVVGWAVVMARKRRESNRKKQGEMRLEMSQRARERRPKKEQKDRKAIEQKMKRIQLDDVQKEFPELESNTVTDLVDVLSGEAVGRNICHVWFDSLSKEKTVYSGKLEKLKRKNSNVYVIAYWNEARGESYNEAVDYEMSKSQLAVDLVCDNLSLS